jgi:hypothetical protein
VVCRSAGLTVRLALSVAISGSRMTMSMLAINLRTQMLGMKEVKGIARRRKRRWEDEILTPQT